VTKDYKSVFLRQQASVRCTIFIFSSLYMSFAHTGLAAADDIAHASPDQTSCGSPATTVALPIDGAVLKASAKVEEPCHGAGRETTLSFSSVDPTATVQEYSEKGYTLIGRNGLKPCSDDSDCIRAMREQGSNRILVYARGNTNLNLSVDNPDRPFRLKALKICNPDRNTPTQSIMFVGRLANGSTTAFAVTVRGNSNQDQLFMFPESFRNLVSVSWSPKNTAVTDITLVN
jgi:hypothetical protein